MDFVTLASIRAEYRPLLDPATPVPTLDRAIRRAATQFCIASEAIRETIEAVAVTADEPRVALTTSGSTFAVALHDASYNARRMDISSPQEVARFASTNTAIPPSGTPTRIYLDAGAALVVAPTPVETASLLTVRVAVAPTRSATSIPSEFSTTYFEQLLDGTKAMLLAMPEASWSNPQAALQYRGMFMAAARSAKSMADHNNTRRKTLMSYGGY